MYLQECMSCCVMVCNLLWTRALTSPILVTVAWAVLPGATAIYNMGSAVATVWKHCQL